VIVAKHIKLSELEMTFCFWRVWQDEGSFELRNEARQQLAQLGSDWAMELGWRDMWAFIAKKGGNDLYVAYCIIISSCLILLVGFFIGTISREIVDELL